MRGHRDENVTVNFNCLLALIRKFNPDVEKYLGSENKAKFLSPQIQNEVLRNLAHTLLRGLFDRIRAESIGVDKKESLFSTGFHSRGGGHSSCQNIAPPFGIISNMGGLNNLCPPKYPISAVSPPLSFY